MSNYEFMLTKNFNSKVTCSFKPEAAMILAPDTATATDLLEFAKFDFDLAELYARKLRKRLYEEKGAFSDANFFQPVYDEINKEFVDRHTAAGKETDLGKNRDKLNELHAQVMQEIDELPDFCKTCKPSKKKNKKA